MDTPSKPPCAVLAVQPEAMTVAEKVEALVAIAASLGVYVAINPRSRYVSLAVADDDAVARLALWAGGSIPERKEIDGKEWIASSASFGGASLMVYGPHRPIVVEAEAVEAPAVEAQPAVAP